MFSKAPSVTFSCTVKELRADRVIENAKFCWKRPRSATPDCENIFQYKSISFGGDYGEVRFSVSFNTMQGANITSQWGELFSTKRPTRTDLSGRYWCEFGNRGGQLISTSFEIQDIMLKYQNIANSNTNTELVIKTHEPITNDNLPLTLECPGLQTQDFNNNSQIMMNSIFSWAFCFTPEDDPITVQKCLGTAPTGMAIGNVITNSITHPNGSLTLLELSPNSKYTNYALVCLSVYDRGNLYGLHGGIGSTKDKLKGLIFDASLAYQKEPVAISPQYTKMEIRAGRHSSPLKLTALYRADYSKAIATWYHKDRVIHSRGSFSKYQYEVGNNIRKEDEGVYKLEVTYGSSKKKLEFYFQVKVNYPPMSVANGPYFDTLDYVLEGGNLDTTVLFDNAERVNILINGLQLSGNINMYSDWNRLHAFRLGLGDLNFTVKPLPPNPKGLITYQMKDAKKANTHSVSFVGENRYGQAVLTKLIHVVPLPIYREYPRNYSCTGPKCLTTQSHDFKCVIDNYNSIVSTGAKIVQSWYLDNDQINEINQQSRPALTFFETFNQSSTLQLKPITDVWVKKVLEDVKSARIHCVVEIFDPQYFAPNELSAKRLYDSRSTSDHAFLTADLQLLAPQMNLVESSLTWIWAVALAVILLFVIGALIAYIIVKEREGATYLVDEQERATGNDPEKEIKEKENFHPYERGEEDMHIYDGSRCSLDNDSVGIHSDSENDVEMYGLDTCKYDEDGSFIYKYGANSTKRPKANGAPVYTPNVQP